MRPASLSSALRGDRDEGEPKIITSAEPNDPRVVWRERFRTVRAETERLAATLDRLIRQPLDRVPIIKPRPINNTPLREGE